MAHYLFYKKIKEIEGELGYPKVILDSFIISPTPLAEIPQQTREMNREEWEAHNVLFQRDDPDGDIAKIIGELI